MAGSILGAGMVAATSVLLAGFVAAGAAGVASQRAAGIADAAALAAADAASGAVAGDPCTRAAEVAGAQGAVVVACDLDELIATVAVEARFGSLAVAARARAGPPPQAE